MASPVSPKDVSLLAKLWSQISMHSVCVCVFVYVTVRVCVYSCAFLELPIPQLSAEAKLPLCLDSGPQTLSLPFCWEGQWRVT